MTGEAHLLDAPVLAHRQLHPQLITTERIEVLELQIRVLELGRWGAPVMRTLVVVEDVLAVEVVHVLSVATLGIWFVA